MQDRVDVVNRRGEGLIWLKMPAGIHSRKLLLIDRECKRSVGGKYLVLIVIVKCESPNPIKLLLEKLQVQVAQLTIQMLFLLTAKIVHANCKERFAFNVFQKHKGKAEGGCSPLLNSHTNVE